MEREVDRTDLHRTRILDDPAAELPASGPSPHRARSRRRRTTSPTACGGALQYWNFFPSRENWGRARVASREVVESGGAAARSGAACAATSPWPPSSSSNLGRFGARVSRHGSAPAADGAAYSRYLFTDSDPVHAAEREPHQMVLWPLFFTSFVIDDFIADNNMFGASTVLVSSASSKTAIGAAYLLAAREGVRVVGLTSAGNTDFVRSLGCYDDTVTSTTCRGARAVFVDIAGNADVQRRSRHFADRLRHSMAVAAPTDHKIGTSRRSVRHPSSSSPTQIAKPRRSGTTGPRRAPAKQGTAEVGRRLADVRAVQRPRRSRPPTARLEDADPRAGYVLDGEGSASAGLALVVLVVVAGVNAGAPVP
jgi:hypothetical protein